MSRREERREREEYRNRMEEERRERREQKIEERKEKEAADRRRDEYFLSLRDARPAAVTPAPTPITDLPRMRENDEVESFIPIFEASLRMNDVPHDSWKAKLTSHLPLKVLVPVEEALKDGDTSYQEKTCVRGRGADCGRWRSGHLWSS